MENNYPGASNIKRTQMLTQKERGFLKVLLLTACLSKSTSCNPHVGQLEITKGEQNRFQKKWQISQHNLWRNRYDARHPSFVKRWNETNQMLWDIFLQNMLFRVSYYFVIFNNTVNWLLVHTSNKEPERVWTKWSLQRMSRNYKGAKGIFQVLCGGESWRTTQFEMRKPARTPQVPFLEPSGGAPCPALWLAKMTSVQLSHWIEMRSGPALVLCNQTRSKSRHYTVTSYNSREKSWPC